MRLLFEGGDYNIQGLAGGGYYSRAATIRGRRLIEEIRYAPCTEINGRAYSILILTMTFEPSEYKSHCSRGTTRFKCHVINLRIMRANKAKECNYGGWAGCLCERITWSMMAHVTRYMRKPNHTLVQQLSAICCCIMSP